MAAENRHPITFYTANTPNGLKVGIYLHEAGLAHQRHPVDLGAGEQKRPEYLKINPNGKIPAIVDHEAGLTVFESGAILSYLSNKTGHLQPDTLAGQLAVQQWLHFQIGGIGPMLGQLWWFLHGSKAATKRRSSATARSRCACWAWWTGGWPNRAIWPRRTTRSRTSPPFHGCGRARNCSWISRRSSMWAAGWKPSRPDRRSRLR